MWKIYDDLINGIPEDLVVDDLICANESSYVHSGNGTGIAGFRPYETRMPMITKNLIGMPLREVASCVKSWNFPEASIGAAAINAYYNSPDVAKKNGVEFSASKSVEDRKFDPFIMSQNDIKDKKVAVVGHFPYIKKLFESKCELHIIDWYPQEGDYPLSSCEYILPECEYVYLTCASIVDKTFPRMLELSKNADRVTVVGPATPLAPVLFDYGVDNLSGFMIKDYHSVFRIISGIEKTRLYSGGQKVNFNKNQRRLTID